MEVGFVARANILLMRAQNCDHVWKRINDTEEQCEKCTVIVTEEGKQRLAAQRAVRRCVHGVNPPEACKHCSRHLERGDNG